MAISNEALVKLIHEIEAKAAVSQKQMGHARSQITAKQRELRLVRLTVSEVDSLPASARVYEGVGRMFISTSMPDVQAKLKTEARELESQVEKLSQRLLYLETTHKNSRAHIEQALQRSQPQ